MNKKEQTINPPLLAQRFLRWYCHPDLFQEIEGDLYELYLRRRKKMSAQKANTLYWFNVITFCQPWAWRKPKHFQSYLISRDMFKNYLISSFRSFLKQKSYFIANLLGISVAVYCLLLTVVYYQKEIRVDSFHTNVQQLYRLNKKVQSEGQASESAESGGSVAAYLQDNLPEVQAVTRVAPWWEPAILSWEDNDLKVDNWVFADANFLEMFSFKVLEGNPMQALKTPGQIVLTQSVAEGLFGEENPIGKSIKGLHEFDYVVSAVVTDPSNTHLQFQCLVAWETTVPGRGYYPYNFMNNWLGQTVYTYVKLHPEANPELLKPKFTAMLEENLPERADEYFHYLQPLSEIYLHSSHIPYQRGLLLGNSLFLNTFGLVSIFILLIAVINYINVNTANVLPRAKEVGLRKIFGAYKIQLIIQFIVEALFLSMLSFAIAYLLLFYTTPYTANFFNVPIEMSQFLQLETLFIAFGIWLIIGLMAGLYPAWLLSKYKPIEAIKNLKSKGKSSQRRYALVTFQIFISTLMVVGTWIVFTQTNFMRNKQLGYDAEQVMILNINNGIDSQWESFRDKLAAHNGVQNISVCQATIGAGGWFGTTVKTEGSEQDMDVRIFRVDNEFEKTYGLTLKEGRFFKKQMASDSNAVVVNEAFLKETGWTLDDIRNGKTLGGDEYEKVNIIGVVKDFHFEPIHQKIVPVVMALNTNRRTNVSIRVKTTQLSEFLDYAEVVWKNFPTRYPFEFTFSNEAFEESFGKEERLSDTLGIFAFISLIISGIGLFGLTSFTINQRTKEIGIRKVLGASTRQVILLISKRYFILGVMAVVLALPLIGWAAQEWLQQFPYRIEGYIWMMVFTAIATVLLILLAVSFQSLKAALANPIKSLKDE